MVVNGRALTLMEENSYNITKNAAAAAKSLESCLIL